MTGPAQRGDTLIEVTFALAILGFVLLGSTAIAAASFRTGQTARERTQVAQLAQEQMEALRSFRDNHTWTEFRMGSGLAYAGIDAVDTSFHMEVVNTGAATEWVPLAGKLTQATPPSSGVTVSVPTAEFEISTTTPGPARSCGYDFVLKYSFDPLGGGTKATNQIATRLANLKYDPNGAPPVCP